MEDANVDAFLTDNDQDAFWLAQVHFSTGNYTRALSFLQRQDLVTTSPACRYLAALCLVKQQKFDEALTTLGDKNPVHLISAPASTRRKLQHVQSRKHNGIARSGDDGGGDSAGEVIQNGRIDRSEERDGYEISNIKFEAAMCYLRGVCYAKQNAFDRAKDCYKDAVRIDVQCFEAFDQLMKNSLMSPREEWDFLESLNFDDVTAGNSKDADPSVQQEAAQFTKMLYTTRLSKYERPKDFTTATETLSTHYSLSSNPDILLAEASLLFTQCRFRASLALTSQILAIESYNFAALPTHLANLHSLNETNALFLLSHQLADTHPSEPVSWLAVGIYYLSINRIADARRYFSKSSMMDPYFGPAWIGFAHTFAAEGEHDQAISAYSTAARLFQGTHLPLLFLGMQNVALQNWGLAHEYLNSAYEICKSDPLLLNELGVVFYHEEHLDAAVKIFHQALELAVETNSDPKAWTATKANLGHAYRRLGHYDQALEAFDEVLREGGKDPAVFCAKGLVLMDVGDTWRAVVALHEALAVAPQDALATELLNKALEISENAELMAESEEDEVDRRIATAGAIAREGRVRAGWQGELEGGLASPPEAPRSLLEDESMVLGDDDLLRAEENVDDDDEDD